MAQIPDKITAREAFAAIAKSAAPDILEISFTGLRRISPQAIRAQMRLRAGEKFEERRLPEDVRALARLGWFRDVRVETRGNDENGKRGLLLIFHLEEQPFVTGVEFTGSRTLSAQQIKHLLQERNLVPRTGAPEDNAAEYRAALTIRRALEQLGHPQAQIQIQRQEFANATARVRFAVADGPHITVSKIALEGNLAFPEKTLLQQTREIRAGEWFAGLRGRNVFSEEKLERDRARLLNYYQDHGYPDAKIGWAKIAAYEDNSRRWLPRPHRVVRTRQTVTVPVEAEKFYRFGEISVSDGLKSAASMQRINASLLGRENIGKPFSADTVERLRRAWFARANRKPGKGTAASFCGVDATRTFDPQSGVANVRLALSTEAPVMVERIEICGLHKFKDRFIRRRLVQQEGKPLDDRALEAGLARLVRTGYFRPLKREDVGVEVNEETRTAKITLRLQEIGQQRISLAGGQSAFGSTLGIVYSVFDLLNREELLSAQIEGGPQSALLALGLAREGFLASRGTLAVSVFDSVLRPKLAGTPKGPFYASRSEGINAGWTYAVSSSDAIGVTYTITQNLAHYSTEIPQALTGIAPGDLRAKTDSRAVGLGWTHDSGNERRIIDGSISGGWLGGNENVLRSSAEFGRIVRDPIVDQRNAWAFRVYARGAGSYSGDMPLYARIFAGDELVRGLRQGELGPYAASSTIDRAGATKYFAAPAGSNLAGAANLEYRVPLRQGVQAAGFFDLGSGLLLPNWLGKSRPALLAGTNGILHGSTGMELSWAVPGVQVPVRAHYAINVLRLNRILSLPGGTAFHAHNKGSAFGWALGSQF